MKELGTELSRRLKEVRDAHESTVPRWSHAVKLEVIRRSRRRRTLKRAGAAVATAGVLAGALAVPVPWSSLGAPRVDAAAGRDGDERLGLWPAVTESDARDLCDSLDLRLPLAAGGLVSETLGWSNVAASERDGDDPGTKTLRYTLVPRTFGATGPVGALPGSNVPDDASALVEAMRLDEGCWWVTSLTSTRDLDVSVTSDGDDLRVEYDLPRGLASADVIAVEQGAEQRRYVAGEPGETAAEIEDFEGPGYVIVLWKTADGWVVTGESRTVAS